MSSSSGRGRNFESDGTGVQLLVKYLEIVSEDDFGKNVVVVSIAMDEVFSDFTDLASIDDTPGNMVLMAKVVN